MIYDRLKNSASDDTSDDDQCNDYIPAGRDVAEEDIARHDGHNHSYHTQQGSHDESELLHEIESDGI